MLTLVIMIMARVRLVSEMTTLLILCGNQGNADEDDTSVETDEEIPDCDGRNDCVDRVDRDDLDDCDDCEECDDCTDCDDCVCCDGGVLHDCRCGAAQAGGEAGHRVFEAADSACGQRQASERVSDEGRGCPRVPVMDGGVGGRSYSVRTRRE